MRITRPTWRLKRSSPGPFLVAERGSKLDGLQGAHDDRVCIGSTAGLWVGRASEVFQTRPGDDRDVIGTDGSTDGIGWEPAAGGGAIEQDSRDVEA